MRNHLGIGTKIYYGRDSIESLKKMKMERVCIVTDKSMVSLGLLDPVLDIIKNKEKDYQVFDQVLPDPSMELVSQGVSHLVAFKPDTIVALGGGSVIDMAKAILFLDLKLQEKMLRADQVEKTKLIAIPTTSGTGSEVTSYSVITGHDGHKIALADEAMIPDLAILDPWFTRSLPKNVIAESGIDVFTHALEAYVSNQANPFSRSYAVEALKLTKKYLPRMYENIGDEEARTNMHIASCLAGLAFESSSLGLNHGMAHSFGGKFKKAHGLCNGVLLPYIVSFNAGLYSSSLNEDIVEKYGQVADLLDLTASTKLDKVYELIDYIKDLKRKLAIPQTISQMGVKWEDYRLEIEAMTQATMADRTTQGNPVLVTRQEVGKLYEKIF